MIPDPKICTICNKEGKNHLIYFKALESQKLKHGQCGHPANVLWVCKNCKNIFDYHKCDKYYKTKGILIIKELINK